jgi:peptidyl-prolyl cis-trans isomerase SurA
VPVKNDIDGTYTFNYIIKVYKQNEQRNFDDARGMVISDYQQVLEDRWLAQLKKKYPVKVNTAVFNSIK